MATQNKNILIPVDLRSGTDVAIRKAIELAGDGIHIHLFHVLQYSKTGISEKVQQYFYELYQRPAYMQAEIQMHQWKDAICKNKEHAMVTTWIVDETPVQQAIEKKAAELRADLIVLVKKKYFSFFPFLNRVIPALLSQNTGTIVLSIKSNATGKKAATVVPITKETSLQEKEIISLICKNAASKIHLVSFINKNKESVNAHAPVFQFYEWLNALHQEIEYAAIQGSNKSRALIHYGAKVNANSILFHNISETKIISQKKKLSTSWEDKAGFIMSTG
ncbi:MAG: universal stress protein [Ferruginibacter sp.]